MDIAELVDNQAEAGIIATLIHHPEFILHSDYLKERYFYKQDNSCIYWAIKSLFANKITNIDAFNITNMLNSNQGVKKTIESYNLPTIQEYMDLCINVKRDTVSEYLMLVNKVVELSFKREFYNTAMSWQKMCFSQDMTLDTLNNKVYKQINDLTVKYVTNGEIKEIGTYVDELQQQLIDKRNLSGTFGIPSFFPLINKYYTYEETELIVIKSRMKKGKSWLALIEGIHKARNGISTIIYDSEMSDFNFYLRAICYISGVSMAKIKSGDMNEDEIKKFDEANIELKTLPLIHLYDPYISRERFYSICSQKIIETNLKFVIWDYIKCDDTIIESSKRSAYMYGVTNWLKNTIAGELNLSVLAFCQLNRQNEVAESDGVERATSVSVTWREKTEEEIIRDGGECGTHLLKVNLNRLGLEHKGEDDYIDMMFTGERVGIVEAKQHSKSEMPF